MAELTMLTNKTLQCGEVLELYRTQSGTQTVYRLVWADHQKLGKPAMLDYADYTAESKAREHFDKTG